MPKYRVQLKIDDNYSVDVEAEDEDEAEQKAIKVIADLPDPNSSSYFNGSSGIEIWAMDEIP